MKRMRRERLPSTSKINTPFYSIFDARREFKIPDKYHYVGAIWYIKLKGEYSGEYYEYIEYLKHPSRFPGDSWGTEYYEKEPRNDYYTRYQHSTLWGDDYGGQGVSMYMMSEEEFTLFKIRENIVDAKT